MYAYWRLRIMYALILGYATFYVVRQNMSIAMPGMLAEFGYTKVQAGWMFSAFSITYGFSKLLSGSLCDRSNARYFMATGLLGAAVVNGTMGLTESFTLLGLCYMGNAWFQSMGWAACARLLTRWYGPKQLATRWAIGHVAHQVGSCVALIGIPLLIAYGGSWRWAFGAPACLCLLVGVFALERLRDTPESLGLPGAEIMEQDSDASPQGSSQAATTTPPAPAENASWREIFVCHILPNKALWCLCGANFFIYIIRMGFFHWAPTFLKEVKGISLLESGIKTAFFEIAGVLGGIVAGWISDKYCSGYRGRVSFVFLALLTLCLVGFWYTLHRNSVIGDSLLLLAMGFLTYGPQVLIGVASAEAGSKRAACTAAGLAGTFGYLGGATAGIGIGYLAQHHGWQLTLGTLVGASILCMVFILGTWNNRAESSH